MANIMKNIHFLLWWLTFLCFYANTNTKAPSSSSRYAWEADLGLGDEGLASHTFGTRRWSLFERLASNDDIGVDIDIVSFASRLRCPYTLFFDMRLSLALNIWLSVNRAQFWRALQVCHYWLTSGIVTLPTQAGPNLLLFIKPFVEFPSTFLHFLIGSPTLAWLFFNISLSYHVGDGMIMMMWWWWWWHFCSGFVVWHNRRFVHFGAPVLGEAAPRNHNFCQLSSAMFRRSIDEDTLRKVLRITIKKHQVCQSNFFPETKNASPLDI